MSSASTIPPRPFSRPVLDRLAGLSPRAEHSDSLFAAPLGPDEHGFYLPRFAVFGANTSDTDARLSVLAGFAQGDDASSLAAFDLIEAAAAAPEAVGGLVLDVVPVVNRSGGDLWSASWIHAERAELALLEREYRRVPPHARLQLRSGTQMYPHGVIHGASIEHWLDGAPAVLFSAGWSRQALNRAEPEGIDSLVPDLPFRPLELQLTLGLDADGNAAALHAIVQRIRQLLAHGQYL